MASAKKKLIHSETSLSISLICTMDYKEPSLCTTRDLAERAVHYTGNKTNLHFAVLWCIDKETKDNFKSQKKVGIQFLLTFIWSVCFVYENLNCICTKIS